MRSNKIVLKLVNVFLVVWSLIIIADANEDIGDYRTYEETFHSFRIAVSKPGNMGNVPGKRTKKRYEKYLALSTEEGSEWFITEDQKQFWNALTNPDNVGKQLNFTIMEINTCILTQLG